MPTITWNPNAKLILADVDDTICPPHELAVPALILELNRLLDNGLVLFFISGSAIAPIQKRITDHLSSKNRARVLIGHCNGSEVYGFDQHGTLLPKPFYSQYEDRLNSDQKQRFRQVVQALVKEFKFKTFPTLPRQEFRAKTGGHPLAVILEDKGPQITFGMANSLDLTDEQMAIVEIEVPKADGARDLRTVVISRANELFDQYDVPVVAYRAGVSAIDMTVKDASKTTAVEFIVHDQERLAELGLPDRSLLLNPEFVEVWGDRFSKSHGTDWMMSAGINPRSRSIDFRDEDPADFPAGFNIVLWDGNHQLDAGLLDFLQDRHSIH